MNYKMRIIQSDTNAVANIYLSWNKIYIYQ